MSDPVEIKGQAADGFEAVRDAFARNFAEFGEQGAACAISLGGELVVDIWAGEADRERTRPWTDDTIVNVYSCTKGMAALCAHMLVDRGLLDVEAPVTEYWPEFGKEGKQTLPVKYLLTHQAGLPVIDEDLPDNAALDWERMVGALERQAPVWEPGEKNGYHAVTFGWLVGEVVRRVSGAASLGTFFREQVAEPLAIDFFIGTPEREHHRVADLVRDRVTPTPATSDQVAAAASRPARTSRPTLTAAQVQAQMASLTGPGSLMRRALALSSRPFAPSNNDPRWRMAEIPAANGHGNARALATVYGVLANGGEINGVKLLSPEAIRRAAAPQVQSPDEVLIRETKRTLGFMMPVPGTPDHRGPNSFGHAGAGGALGFADPDLGIGFGYTMNKMWNGGFMAPDPRSQTLIAAMNEALVRS